MEVNVSLCFCVTQWCLYFKMYEAFSNQDTSAAVEDVYQAWLGYSRVDPCCFNHAFSPRSVYENSKKKSCRVCSSSSTSPGNRPSESCQDALVVPDSDDEEMPENQRTQMPEMLLKTQTHFSNFYCIFISQSCFL